MKQYVKVSNTNSKLGGQIYSINLPAVVTCRPDAPCFKGCYARKGNWTFSNVKSSLESNLEAYKSNPDLFFESIAAQTVLTWIPENPYDLPMTYVYGEKFNNDLIPKDAIPCGGKCETCQACWTLKKGQHVYFMKH